MNETVAKEVKNKRISLVWIIPFLALMVTGVLLYNRIINKGPVIKINVHVAQGVEAGKTLVKFRSVTIGQVVGVDLDDDLDKVILTVQMNKDTERLLNEDSLFWIVKPRVEYTGISGLDTILSGVYIECLPGNSGVKNDTFYALDSPPALLSDLPGIKFTLSYQGKKRISVGDDVFYKGFSIGNIISSKLDPKQDIVFYTAFIKDEYAPLISTSSRFWISNGINARLDTNGFSFNSESFNNILKSGISLVNFKHELNNSIDFNNMELSLFDRYDDALNDYLSSNPCYVALIDTSLKNIKVGSSVLYSNVEIGKVIKAPFVEQLSSIFKYQKFPVKFALNLDNQSDLEFIKQKIEQSLANKSICLIPSSSSLISGINQLELKLDCKNLRNNSNIDNYLSYTVIPVDNKLDDNKLDLLFDKINAIDTQGISDELKSSLSSFKLAMDAFKRTNNAFMDKRLLEQLSSSLNDLTITLQSYDKNSELYMSILQSLQTLQGMLKDVAPAMNKIGQKPNSIFFDSGSSDFKPKAFKDQNK